MRKKRNVSRLTTKEATYRVEPGDTIWTIADKHSVNPVELQKRNRISDPRTLKIGAVLIIPGSRKTSSRKSASTVSANSKKAGNSSQSKTSSVSNGKTGSASVGNPMLSGGTASESSMKKEDPRLPKIVFKKPVKGKIIEPFGSKKAGTQLEGILIEAASAGEHVCASGEGQVVFSGELEGYGRLVILDHKNGYYTVYAKMARLIAQLNAEVKTGDVLGEPGKIAGNSTGVHFEVRHHDVPVNPTAFLE